MKKLSLLLVVMLIIVASPSCQKRQPATATTDPTQAEMLNTNTDTSEDNVDTDQSTGTIAQGNTVAEKFDWLNAFAQTGGSYIVEVRADEIINKTIGLYYGGKSDITITLKGVGANRTLSISSYNKMFHVNSGITLVLDNNITLRNNNQPVSVIECLGTLIMNIGSAITGSCGGSSLVSLSKGTFIMNGGTISGNNNSNITGSYGGGVDVESGATFTMNGGTISGNTNGVGGVYVGWNGTFIMNGGTISGNTAQSNGGGVYMEYRASFTKTGGTITGYTGDQRNGNVVKDRSEAVQNYKGHAVYAQTRIGDTFSFKIREGTAGPGDNMSFDGTKNPQIASGAWDN